MFINCIKTAPSIKFHKHPFSSCRAKGRMNRCGPASKRISVGISVIRATNHVMLFTDWRHGPYCTAVELVKQCRGSATDTSTACLAVSRQRTEQVGQRSCLHFNFFSFFLTRPANTSNSCLILISSRRLKILKWVISWCFHRYFVRLSV